MTSAGTRREQHPKLGMRASYSSMPRLPNPYAAHLQQHTVQQPSPSPAACGAAAPACQIPPAAGPARLGPRDGGRAGGTAGRRAGTAEGCKLRGEGRGCCKGGGWVGQQEDVLALQGKARCNGADNGCNPCACNTHRALLAAPPHCIAQLHPHAPSGSCAMLFETLASMHSAPLFAPTTLRSSICTC